MQSNELIVLDSFRACMAYVRNKYRRSAPEITISLTLFGSAAGKCTQMSNIWFEVNLNIEYICNGFHEVIAMDAIPHEIAHAICIYNGNGAEHSTQWKDLCKEFGGTGNIFHTINASDIPRNIEYCNAGNIFIVSDALHNRIQSGFDYKVAGYGILNKSNIWRKL